MDDLKEAIAQWEATGTTGLSAVAIAAQLTGFYPQHGDYPSDAADFGRCERLLDMVPALRTGFEGMAHVNAYWAALVPAWDAIKASDDRTAAIKAIITPIEDADPAHVRMSEGVSIRFGTGPNPQPQEEPMPEQSTIAGIDTENDHINNKLYADIAALVVKEGKCSTSFVQRQFSIGYNKAARMVERMEEQGLVSAADHVGHRTVATAEDIASVLAAIKRIGAKAEKAIKNVPKKNTPEDDAVTDATYRVTANELRQFVERVERLDAEKKDLADQQKEVMAEAKSRGYDTKVLRKIIALRKRDADDIAEEQATLDMYLEALGM